jgi:L-rhamnose mutarotase
MQRVCFTVRLKKNRIDDYLKAHQVWPEMLQAMHDAGIRNYSMFMSKDGMVVGYLEADDVDEALRKCGQTDVSRRWQERMAEYFEAGGSPQAQAVNLDEYFYMP